MGRPFWGLRSRVAFVGILEIVDVVPWLLEDVVGLREVLGVDNISCLPWLGLLHLHAVVITLLQHLRDAELTNLLVDGGVYFGHVVVVRRHAEFISR